MSGPCSVVFRMGWVERIIGTMEVELDKMFNTPGWCRPGLRSRT